MEIVDVERYLSWVRVVTNVPQCEEFAKCDGICVLEFVHFIFLQNEALHR